MFAGTSMGAANAAALATGMDFERIISIYVDDGPDLFAERYAPSGFAGKLLRFLTTKLKLRWLNTLDSLFNPKWEIAGLEKERRMEEVSCWRDITRLKSELRETLKEFNHEKEKEGLLSAHES